MESNLNQDHECPAEPPRKVKKSPRFTQNAFYYFQSFSDNASIDGLKFVGEEGRTLIERIFWTIIITIALIFSVILVYQTFLKWIHSPVLVTFDTTHRPIYEIPFPAITICPEFKAKKDVFNFTDVYLKMDENITLTHNESMGFDALSLICAPEEGKVNKKATYADEDTLKFLYEVAPKAEDFIRKIKWKGKQIHPSHLSKVLTPDGVCYSFNSLDKHELFTENSEGFPEDCFRSPENESGWTPETRFQNVDMDGFPKRTFISGIKGGLEITFQGFRFDLDYVCGDALEGFKVAVHHPAEIPRTSQNFFRVPINQAVVVGIKPLTMMTSDDLKAYDAHDRQCYFVREKKMQFFNIYNQRNCLTECLANFTLKSCGCVNFYLPRSSETPVCGIAQQFCTEKATVLFLSGEIKKKISNGQTKSKNTSFLVELPKHLDDLELDFDNDCDCLPSCFAIDFAVETSQSDWGWKSYMKSALSAEFSSNDSFLEEWFLDEIFMSQMMVFYTDMQFMSSERNELYGYIDFWANVGGIIGLFTGFSCITIFEILYYLSLRLTCNIRLFGRRFWSGSPKVLKTAVP